MAKLQSSGAALRGIFNSLQLFSRLEAHGLPRRDVHFFSSARVAANAGLARLYAEDAEAPEFDALPAAERVLPGLEDGFHRLLGFRSAAVRLGEHGVYDVELDQQRLPRCVA